MQKQDDSGKASSVNVTNQIVVAQKNPLGTAGFVLALIDLFLGWVPFLGWLLWILGAVFSVIGIFKRPKGLAIAGTIISFIGLIIILVIAGGIASLSLF